MLYRNKSLPQIKNSTSSITELIIAKQRNGPVGNIKLAFNEKQIKFVDFND